VKTLIALFAAVLACSITVSADMPPCHDRVERAVIRRDLAALEECREALRKEASSHSYTLAYLNTRLSPILPEGRAADRKSLLAEAEDALTAALRRHPDDAEAHALLASVYGAQIRDSPWKALTAGPKVASAFERAERLEPRNPRVALLKGISLIYVPRPLGGGLEAAEKELRRARALFAAEPAGKPWPNWGRLDTLAWLGQVRARQGDREQARDLYRQALELAPDSVWVRRDLLPAVER
jgi:Flp pilus assembly protein TadD